MSGLSSMVCGMGEELRRESGVEFSKKAGPSMGFLNRESMELELI